MTPKRIRGKAVMALLLFALLLFTKDANKANAAEGALNNRCNVVFVLDASGSMNTTDELGLRFEAINLFIGLLAEQGNFLGAVVFSNAIIERQDMMAINQNEDKSFVKNLLGAAPVGGWTNIGEGLLEAVEILIKEKHNGNPSAIVLLSDGNSEMGSKEELVASLEKKADAIQLARENSIPIYSVCLNADGTADISEMEQISAATGGSFQEVSKAEHLKDVFNMFYTVVYGTATVNLIDEVFPEDGCIITEFEVPGFGVEEVNIVINGEAKSISIQKPDGTNSDAVADISESFTLIKLTDVQAGNWMMTTYGVPGDRIKINMIFNTEFAIELAVQPEANTINPEDALQVVATLKSGDITATTAGQYAGYEAVLEIFDVYGEPIDSVPMRLFGNRFEVKQQLEEGTYFYQVIVTGHSLEKYSEQIGPLLVSAETLSEMQRNNTAPLAVEDEVEKKVYIWPVKGGNLTLDLKTLATDQQDEQLHYKIQSTSFVEEDYSVTEDDILVVDNFSLKKGAFTIRATDTGGLHCDIEVIIKTHNVGIIALIGIGCICAIVFLVMVTTLYIALNKPFRGTIFAQSYCNGAYRGIERSPRRGRCKLSMFGLEPIGLVYNKCYFQATGTRQVYLVTNKPVIWNGQPTKKVRIESGAEVSVRVNENDQNMILLRFESRIQASRSPGKGRFRFK